MVGIENNVKIVDIEPLVEGCWDSWLHDVRFCFLEAGFILNSIDAPNETNMKKVQNEWHTII